MNNVNTPYDDVFRTMLTDSSFLVVRDGISKSYHIECQSTPDGTMAIRMFEYDSQIALQDSLFERGILTVNFPHSAILCLRHASGTPSQFTITINTPGGQISYSIPSLKVQTYSIDTIFEKRLYFLIPFYIFTYESQLKSIENDSSSPALLTNMKRSKRRYPLKKVGCTTEVILSEIIDNFNLPEEEAKAYIE